MVKAVKDFQALRRVQEGKEVEQDDLILGWTSEGAVQKHFERHLPPKFVKKWKTHDFRSAKASHMYIKNGEIVEVQAFLGHSDTNITRRYIK